MKTWAPSEPRCSDIARPKPLDAPVTHTVRPWIDRCSDIFFPFRCALTVLEQNVRYVDPDILSQKCQTGDVATTDSAREQRIDDILRASIPLFAQHGYRKSSMATIAAAAGLSRPALYQYFTDRADLFAAAYVLLLDEATDAALAELELPVPLAAQLDGYLQRISGDGYAMLAATKFGDELLEARHQFAAEAAEAAVRRAHKGLRAHLKATPTDQRSQDRAFEVLTLSTFGLKQDRPSPATYRRRLTFLAGAIARALLEVGEPYFYESP